MVATLVLLPLCVLLALAPAEWMLQVGHPQPLSAVRSCAVVCDMHSTPLGK